MLHARPDYNVVQDISIAKLLAEMVMTLPVSDPSVVSMKELAMVVLEQKRPPADSQYPMIPFDEPVFLIRAQDQNGADVLRYWAKLAEDRGAKSDIVQRVRDHADRMQAWGYKKTPDLKPGTV